MSVSHGFELVVELESVITVVHDVRAVPDDAPSWEDPTILRGGDCGHVVDKPGALLVVVQLHTVGVGNLVVVGGGVEGVHHHVLLPGVPIQLGLEEPDNRPLLFGSQQLSSAPPVPHQRSQRRC